MMSAMAIETVTAATGLGKNDDSIGHANKYNMIVTMAEVTINLIVVTLMMVISATVTMVVITTVGITMTTVPMMMAVAIPIAMIVITIVANMMTTKC